MTELRPMPVSHDELLEHLVNRHSWHYLDIYKLDQIRLRKLHEETSHAQYDDLSGHRHSGPAR